MIGVPVIVNHKDLSQNNADDERVGVVSNVWFDEKDGWYWCDGIIWDETAQNLITDKGWSVSCSYDVKLADDAGGTENNVPYDIEFLDGVFTHLAIVDNPRYERANIVFNSKTVINNQFKEEEHPRDENGRFTSGGNGVNPNYQNELKQVIDKAKNNPNERQKLVIGIVSKDLAKKAKENGFDITGYEHNLDVSGTRHTLKTHGNEKKEDSRGQIAITDEDFEKIPDVVYTPDNISFGETDAKDTPLIKYSKKFDDGTVIYVEEIRTRQKTLTIKSMWKQKNIADNSRSFTDLNPQRKEYISNIIITDIQDGFNPNVQNIKEHEEMALLDELKKLITKVENDKGEDMDDNKDKEKIENEKVDKRKHIREVEAALFQAGVKKEIVYWVTKLMEENSYEPSEAGTADNSEQDQKKEEKPADNKRVKNEDEEDKEEVKDLKKEMKEDAENKKSCKNSVDNTKGGFFERLNEVYNSAMQIKEESLYVSRQSKLDAANKYFAK